MRATILELCVGLVATLLGAVWLARASGDIAGMFASPAAATATRAPHVASYTLSARLDEATHKVHGSGTIRWTNTSNRPATELWFHLYLNAFKNDETVFLRSRFAGARSEVRPKSWGYIDVHELRWVERGNVDLWSKAARHSPGDPKDATDIAVPLPAPVEPGASITLRVRWTSQLPSIVERTGYSHDFHMVAQWFPKLATFSADGTWAHFPFHAHSEFYADFGAYDVTLDVPAHAIVGATGVKVSEQTRGDRKTVQHRIDAVHDFAWVAWRGFEERRRRIGDVEVRLLYPPGNARNADVTLRAVDAGLADFGAAYGRYPYPVLTVVHPPWHARPAGGMEYPTLITTGGPWYLGYFTTFIERVTLHELGHQWFYGLVATDEHRWPFLDEGLTMYAETRAMRQLFGEGAGVDLFGVRISSEATLRAMSASVEHRDAVAQMAEQFASFGDLGGLVYARTPTILSTLARVYGVEAVDRALGEYARRHRFSHPKPEDLLRAVRDRVGADAADTLQKALFEGAWVDFTVGEVETTPYETPAGVFDRATGRATVPDTNASDSARWIGRVLVYREGSLRLPVDIDLILSDGRRERRHWDGRGEWVALDYTGTARLVGAMVDPDLKVLLDNNLLNNAMSTKSGTLRRVMERSTYAAQLLLGALGP